MKHDAHAFACAPTGCAVADISVDELDPTDTSGEILQLSTGEIVENAYVSSVLEQGVHQMRTDEARSTANENSDALHVGPGLVTHALTTFASGRR